MSPATQCLSPSSAPAGEAEVDFQKQRLIFLVDDDRRTLGVLEAILSGAGFEVRSFETGREALEVFGRIPVQPRLLITDYGMNDMNGFELIQRCRALCPHLKVIMLSGTLDHEAARQFPFRVELFLPKPVRSARLLDAVHRFLPPSR